MSAPHITASNRLIVKATLRTPDGITETVQGEQVIAFWARNGWEVTEVTGRPAVTDRMGERMGWNEERIDG